MGLFKDIAIRGLLLVALPWGCRLAMDAHKEVTARQQKDKSYPQYDDLLQGAGILVGMLVVQLLFRPFFSVVARAMIPRRTRWSHAVWGAKVIRCCDAVFKFLYYTIMTLWAARTLIDEKWMPVALGGSGEMRFCWTDGHPFQPMGSSLRWFYLTAMGFHMSEVVMLMLEARHPDFWEMLLHHSVSVFLVFFSYFLNYVRIGSVVLLLHGATDIFIYLSKIFVDTPYMKLTGIAYVGMIASYCYLRIYVFPMYVMRSAWVESVQEVGQDVLFGWGFLNFCLVTLLTLHMYWFGLIVKIGLVFRKEGRTRDLQANLSSLDVRDKKAA